MKKHLVIAVAAFSALSALADTPTVTRRILPVAGSTAGAFGSNFKTELQLNNRSAQPMSGTIIFHPQGQNASAGDPRVTYSLDPHQTVEFDDIVGGTLHVNGLGSIDIVSDAKGVPTIVARAYDDQGDKGTNGATIPAVRPDDALQVGDSSSLIVPLDHARYRFNLGIRTLESGATISATIYGEDGIVRKTLSDVSYGADYFVQVPADTFAGQTLLANESIVFTVKSGSVIVYGTTTDNATNDPSVQLTRRPAVEP